MQFFLSTSLIVLVLSLTTSVHAAGHLEIRAAAAKCNADNCYRAAVASSAKPGAASASADCASFMRATATPCPTTTTITTSIATSTVTTTVGGVVLPPSRELSGGRAAILKRQDPGCTAPTTVYPTAVPAYATSACGPASSASARYSSACSCKGQTRTVSEAPTPTSTQSVAVFATPALCSNQGVNFKYYVDNSYSNFGDRNTNYQFDPTVYNGKTPQASGQTNTGTIGQIQYNPINGPTDIYGQSLQSDNYVIDHTTYFVAPLAGTYTFSVTGADDYISFYAGDTAVSGYTSSNTNFIANFYNVPNNQYSQILEPGQFLPLRLFFVNAPGGARLQFSVTGPAPFTSTDSLKPFFVRSSCDSTKPEF